MITGAARFAALMSGKKPDRVPFVCNLLDQGAREMGVSLREYYGSGELVARGQLRQREKYGYDTLCGMFYTALEAELLGCRHIIYAEDGPPNVGELIIREPADIDRLLVPETLEHMPRFRELATSISSMKRESQGNYPVLAEVTASFSLPAMLMGIGQWMKLFLGGDTYRRDLLLEKCSRFCALQIEALRAAGADLIAYINPVASSTFITGRQFRELALPWILRDLEQPGYNGMVFFNGGGKINPILADLREHTGFGAYYINPFDDPAEARRLLGPGALLVAPINDIMLLDWTPAEIDLEVERIMAAGKPGGGFVFGTLLMPFLIPEANIRALADAVYRHGVYDGAAA